MFTKIIALLFAISFLAACNTVHGFGQDVEKGGEKVQKKSDDAK